MSEVFVRGHFVDEMGARVSEQITLQINEQIRFRTDEQITLHMNGQISRQMSQPIRLQMIACRASDEQMMRDEDEDQERLIQKETQYTSYNPLTIGQKRQKCLKTAAFFVLYFKIIFISF